MIRTYTRTGRKAEEEGERGKFGEFTLLFFTGFQVLIFYQLTFYVLGELISSSY